MLKRNEVKNNITPKELKYISFEDLIAEIKLNSKIDKINLSIECYKEMFDALTQLSHDSAVFKNLSSFRGRSSFINLFFFFFFFISFLIGVYCCFILL